MADQTWLQTHSLLTPGLLEDKFPLDRINQRGSYKIKGTKDPTQKRGKGNPQDKGEERSLQHHDANVSRPQEPPVQDGPGKIFQGKQNETKQSKT